MLTIWLSARKCLDLSHKVASAIPISKQSDFVWVYPMLSSVSEKKFSCCFKIRLVFLIVCRLLKVSTLYAFCFDDPLNLSLNTEFANVYQVLQSDSAQ